MFTLRVPRDVDASTERDRPRVEAFRERRLTRADDACEHHIRCGDQAPLVEHPWVVHEAAARVEILTYKDAARTDATLRNDRARTPHRMRAIQVGGAAGPPAAGR